jgi:hypothetical protein
MVGLQIVDILAEDERPEILANKLDDVQAVIKARTISRKSASVGKGACVSMVMWQDSGNVAEKMNLTSPLSLGLRGIRRHLVCGGRRLVFPPHLPQRQLS